MGLLIEGAMQQAAQCGRQSIVCAISRGTIADDARFDPAGDFAGARLYNAALLKI
jgi:hypothetical protein